MVFNLRGLPRPRCLLVLSSVREMVLRVMSTSDQRSDANSEIRMPVYASAVSTCASQTTLPGGSNVQSLP